MAIVGAGYTGLIAALTCARAGRGVVVLDAEDAGFGCSTRNGGQCGASLKIGFDELALLLGALIICLFAMMYSNALAVRRVLR